MASYNRVVLVGNLTRTPELRHTQETDLAVARTAIAVSRKYKEREEVMFIDLVMWGKQAEVLCQYATKGTPVLVEGKLSQNSWEQDGIKRTKHEIRVDSFQLLGSRRERTEDSGGNFSSSDAGFSSAPAGVGAGAASAPVPEDEDIPF
ncbi:single-stranded DNA-binding protein [Deferribacterales bacterium RsTz2092]|nr:single-stranded DNA-binding protein [Deferribacterales bacterium]